MKYKDKILMLLEIIALLFLGIALISITYKVYFIIFLCFFGIGLSIYLANILKFDKYE